MRVSITDDFDLNLIAESGQCFRWEKTDESTFRIPSADKCLIIRRLANSDYDFSCDEAEYERYWKSYLDLDTDYGAIRGRIKEADDEFLYTACESKKGIRILNQDIWETLISFIISQNRNIPAIKKSIETLCRLAGDRHTDAAGEEYYTFPCAEAICAMSEEEIAECRLGYRDKYIMSTAKACVDGELDIEVLSKCGERQIEERLLSLYGVGRKVASCVMLFGFHKLNYFPVDVWIKKVLKAEYKNGYPFEKYSPYNGVYQQYMFEYYRNSL